jgi:hypothetical protein
LIQKSQSKKPLSQPQINRAAWKGWEGSARRFKELDIRLQARQELLYNFLTDRGYQVRIHRAGMAPFNRRVPGNSEKSLRKAMRIRDEALRERPERRLNQIPRRVLRALGLSGPVRGISRLPSRSVYRVVYNDAAGRRQLRQFYFRAVPEEDAYAAAIAFLQTRLK